MHAPPRRKPLTMDTAPNKRPLTMHTAPRRRSLTMHMAAPQEATDNAHGRPAGSH